VVPTQVQQLEVRALGRRRAERGPHALERGGLVVEAGRGHEGHPPPRAQEIGQGRPADRPERAARVQEDAHPYPPSSRLSWDIDLTT